MSKKKEKIVTIEVTPPMTPEIRASVHEARLAQDAETAGLEDELKTSASRYRQRIKEGKLKSRDLAMQLRAGKHKITVDCYERPNYGTREMELVNVKTGDIEQTRGLNSDEIQERWDFEGDALPPPLHQQPKREPKAEKEPKPKKEKAPKGKRSKVAKEEPDGAAELEPTDAADGDGKSEPSNVITIAERRKREKR